MSSNLDTGFQERLAEVEAYLEFLTMIEAQTRQGPPRIEGAEHPITSQQQRILYSSVYLQLYNLVEATMSRCIEAVSEAAANNAQCKPFDLNESMRREWVRVTARTHTELTPENRLDKALQLCEHLVNSLPIGVFKIDKGGGGNWDDAEIEAFSKRLGLDLVVSKPVYRAIKQPFRDDLGPLALVKQLRNNLAHGSISFAQCADDVTVERLVELKDRTVNYLKEVVNCFTRYIDDFGYLLSDRRPE
ncbi:MAG: MAE_28990/MAE_18760 family HEPN-like nuclease [Lautropia sp.]|nr:MAE_28990/MAE_18760 family HEPN-like nuclease [Lautropia sp.]